jgi:tRNA(Arg) A34 adenosine deaminase TadA
MSGARMNPAEMRDLKYMREALREARRGCREDEVPVGAVVVREEQVIARAHNRPLHLNDPTAHAEVLALRRAARKLGNYRLVGCALYVTIEPCVMCVGAIVQARLRKLVIGARDAKAGACGTALSVLNDAKLNHRVEVQSGILAEECAGMLREFFRQRRSKSPSSFRIMA